MRPFLTTLVLSFFSLMICQAQERASTKSDNVSFLKKKFVMPKVNDLSHKIWLYLPPDYESSKKKYPVIYMHDGQNLFDDKTSYVGEWKVDETLNKIYKETGKGFIVVGIEHGGKERVNEYTPWPHEKYGGGKGKEYIHFIVNVLKPYIDANYRTKSKQKYTGLMGSSLGGLISYYGGLTYPDVFGKIGALSTSFWFSDEVFELTKKKGNQQNLRLFLLVGGKEGDSMVSDMYKAEKTLLETGFRRKNIISKLNKQAEHNEAFWSSELETVVKWLYEIK
jgi:alpha-glucosidase